MLHYCLLLYSFSYKPNVKDSGFGALNTKHYRWIA